LALFLLDRLQVWVHDSIALSLYPTLRHSRAVKKEQAVEDIRGLLKSKNVVVLASVAPWVDITLFTKEFQNTLKDSVRSFVSRFPDTTQGWTLLGFSDLA